jgi:cation diffusion facilitator CzcD-associated flavoprotein CzcO
MPEAESSIAPSIAIVGCGFGGIALGIALHKAGIDDFTIYERADEIGGVWRDNIYPGAACDVPSRFYCFSFEQDFPWKSLCAPQSQIFGYLKHCVEKYELARHLRFGVEITEAAFNEQKWTLKTGTGDAIDADMFVSSVGLFNRPKIPEITGREDFAGTQFHSARWDPAFDPAGKRVAVVGTGASAIQFVPAIAPDVAQLYVCQRTPHFVGAIGARTGELDEGTWLSRRIDRFKLFRQFESGTRRRASPRLTKKAQDAFLAHLERSVPDEELRRRLTPDYPIGCKRMLRSDDWYPALQRENVELVDVPIARIVFDGIVTGDGAHRPVDAIIWATGFTPTDYLAPMRVTVAGFPNFFMTYGPNTNLSGSIIFMIECQARYITDAIRTMRRRRAASMNVKAQRQRAYNEMVQRRIAKTVLVDETCHSYFQTATGKVTTQWPGFMSEYLFRTRRVKRRDYEFG